MGQSKVLSFLCVNPNGWFSIDDIVMGTGMSQSSVSRCLSRLRIYKSVDVLLSPGSRIFKRFRVSPPKNKVR